jgi:hypothetical protein
MLQLVRRRPLSTVSRAPWSFHWQLRPRASRRAVWARKAESLGTIAFHLAAAEVQRSWRGFASRGTRTTRAALRVIRAESRAASRAESRASAARSAGAAAAPPPPPPPNATEMGLVARFLDAKAGVRDPAAQAALIYRDWCATRLQAWLRMARARRAWRAGRFRIFHVASRSLQRWWLEVLLRRAELADAPQRNDLRQPAARAIQRAWAALLDRRVMRYFAELICFREQGSARALLRSINPREAALLDLACGAHVRFRLGGLEWPPRIYYKIYTHAAVTDICAFAPRDYTRAKQLPARKLNLHPQRGEARRAAETREGWYHRIENNGWRPVQASLLGEDAIARATGGKVVPFLPTRTQRREDVLQRRRARKLDWMRRMYADKGGPAAGAAAAPDGAAIDDGLESADCLLQWTDELDFDGYYNDWLTLATSGRARPPGLTESLDYESDHDELIDELGDLGVGDLDGSGASGRVNRW